MQIVAREEHNTGWRSPVIEMLGLLNRTALSYSSKLGWWMLARATVRFDGVRGGCTDCVSPAARCGRWKLYAASRKENASFFFSFST